MEQTTADAGWADIVTQAVAQDLRIIAERLIHVDHQVDKHVAKPWHEGAGEAIIRLQEQAIRRGQ